MKKYRLTFILLLLSLTVTYGYAVHRVKSYVIDLSLPGSIRSDAPVVMTVGLKDIGWWQLCFRTFPGEFTDADLEFSIKVYDRMGIEIPRVESTVPYDMDAPRMEDFVLWPTQTLERKTDLGQYYRFAPGHYKIAVDAHVAYALFDTCGGLPYTVLNYLPGKPAVAQIDVLP